MAGSHSHQILTSSVDSSWRTPQYLFDALDREFDFLLDCAADNDTRKTDLWLGPGSSILEDAVCGVPWAEIAASLHATGRSLFVNPPYCRGDQRKGIPGMPIEPWVEAAAKAGESITTVAILPYATQTKWWAEFVYGPLYRATQIRRFHYRISFDPPLNSTKPKLNANVNTAVVIWSPLGQSISEPWVPHEFYWDVRPKGE